MDCSVDADANTKYHAHVAHCVFGRMLTATPTHSENEFHASRHILLGEVDDATLRAGRGRSGWKTMPPNAFTPGIFLIIPPRRFRDCGNYALRTNSQRRTGRCTGRSESLVSSGAKVTIAVSMLSLGPKCPDAQVARPITIVSVPAIR